MIAVLIGIILLIVVIAVLLFIGFFIGIVCGLICATDEILDDPYLKAAALRVIRENSGLRTVRNGFVHDTVKDRINNKL